MSALLPVEEALAQVLASASPTQAVIELPLLDALGHVLAQDVVSPIAVPGYDNSAMDGYALRRQDAAEASPDSPVELRIAFEVAAGGAAGASLGPG